MTRRDFIGSLAFCTGSAMAGGVADAVLSDAPRLKVGILSDIHLSDEAHRPSKAFVRMFEKTLRFYRDEGVDAVVIAGDLTNGGWMSEMRVVVEAWKRAFAGGPEPVRVFVTGNHEKVFFEKAKAAGKLDAAACADALYNDIRANWKALFGEEWSPFFIKRVKGFAFVGAHWGENLDEKALRGFMDAHRAELSGTKPFFFVQHAHPKNTCYGPTAWDQANGGATATVLSGYPNAVAFSGHTHYSLVDERSVWQGGFTSIGTAALRCVYLPDSGHENSGAKKRMTWMRGGSQGMLMRVFADRLCLARYDLATMARLGEDWIVPVPADPRSPAFAFASRAKRSRSPEFPPEARISTELRRGKDPKGAEEDQLSVTFPAAVGRGDSLSRVFDYEVRVEGSGAACTKLVYQPGVLGAPPAQDRAATCVFGLCELPPKPWRIVVTPRNSLAVRGRPFTMGVK